MPAKKYKIKQVPREFTICKKILHFIQSKEFEKDVVEHMLTALHMALCEAVMMFTDGDADKARGFIVRNTNKLLPKSKIIKPKSLIIKP